MKARDFVAQPVKLSYDAKWEEASPAHGQIGCKFAGNSDPLRGIIASNSDPF
jgi:hypothetical protein